MAAVSVVVATLDPGSSLPGLVRSVDAQSLPSTEFELVVVDASRDGTTARLQQLAGRRRNVTVLTADPERPVADRLAMALERAAGEHVLVVGQQQRLAPRALELLLETARRSGADVVLGRVVTAGASGSLALPDDAERLDPADVDPTSCLALVRRSLPAGRADSGAALLDLPGLARDAGVLSALGRYACALQDGGGTAPAGMTALGPPTYRWEDGLLSVTVGVRLDESEPAPRRAWLVATRDSAEVAVPATAEPVMSDGTALEVSAVLDPRTAEGGHPLEDGPWELRLRLAWPDRETTTPLAPALRRSAVLAGRPYTVGRAGDRLELDVGATRSSVIGPVPQSRALVTETPRGALVTIDYPGVHVQGDAVLAARLLLDRFGLPARLVCADGRARLEAYVSGIAGTSTVAVLAGHGKPVPIGLRLRVDGVGRMAFETAPPSKGAAGGVPLVQRLRRSVPGALEPTVHRLAQVPALRRTYRRLISR